MAPVKTGFIVSSYEGIKSLEKGGRTASAIVSVVTGCASVVDMGLTAVVIEGMKSFFSWLADKIMNDARDYFILACLIRVEYAIRNGMSFSSGWRAACLKNKCSKCKLCGHNAQNHDDKLSSYLKGIGLLENVSDALDLAVD